MSISLEQPKHGITQRAGTIFKNRNQNIGTTSAISYYHKQFKYILVLV